MSKHSRMGEGPAVQVPNEVRRAVREVMVSREFTDKERQEQLAGIREKAVAKYAATEYRKAINDFIDKKLEIHPHQPWVGVGCTSRNWNLTTKFDKVNGRMVVKTYQACK